VALNIFFNESNSFSKVFAIVGPIPGKPSNMNCFCASGVVSVLVWRIANSCEGFSWRFAIWIRNFAVSDSFSV